MDLWTNELLKRVAVRTVEKTLDKLFPGIHVTEGPDLRAFIGIKRARSKPA